MEMLDTITRIFMISSIAGMIGYAIGMGFDAIDRATEPEEDEEDIIHDTTEIMDYDDAVQYYIKMRDEEENEIRCD